MITVAYRRADSEILLELDPGQEDAVLAAADRHFLPAWSGQNEIRFRAIVARDEARREKSRS